MIYCIAENPRPTDKCVKYAPRHLRVKALPAKTEFNFHLTSGADGRPSAPVCFEFWQMTVILPFTPFLHF